jgi:hypothetical protein
MFLVLSASPQPPPVEGEKYSLAIILNILAGEVLATAKRHLPSAFSHCPLRTAYCLATFKIKSQTLLLMYIVSV